MTLDSILMPAPWLEQALCAQTDPELFYPEKGGSTREAKGVCRRCPVRLDCFNDVMTTPDRFGIWAGFSERERRKIADDPGLFRQAIEEITSTQEVKIMTNALTDRHDPIRGDLGPEEEPEDRDLDEVAGAPEDIDDAVEQLLAEGLIEEAETDAVTIPKEDLPALVIGEDYWPLPDYVADMTRVLLITEVHNDPLVRSIRKIAVQALSTLHSMGVLEADEDPEDDPDEAEAAEAQVVQLDRPVLPEGRVRKTSAAVALMAENGVQASDVREWARSEGKEVSDRGGISYGLVEAYIAAH